MYFSLKNWEHLRAHLGWGAWLVPGPPTRPSATWVPNLVTLRRTVSAYTVGPKIGEHRNPPPYDGAWLTA